MRIYRSRLWGLGPGPFKFKTFLASQNHTIGSFDIISIHLDIFEKKPWNFFENVRVNGGADCRVQGRLCAVR